MPTTPGVPCLCGSPSEPASPCSPGRTCTAALTRAPRRTPPLIHFNLDFAGLAATAVKAWLDPFLRETLVSLLVWPNRIVVPLLSEDQTGSLEMLFLRYALATGAGVSRVRCPGYCRAVRAGSSGAELDLSLAELAGPHAVPAASPDGAGALGQSQRGKLFPRCPRAQTQGCAGLMALGACDSPSQGLSHGSTRRGREDRVVPPCCMREQGLLTASGPAAHDGGARGTGQAAGDAAGRCPSRSWAGLGKGPSSAYGVFTSPARLCPQAVTLTAHAGRSWEGPGCWTGHRHEPALVIRACAMAASRAPARPAHAAHWPQYSPAPAGACAVWGLSQPGLVSRALQPCSSNLGTATPLTMSGVSARTRELSAAAHRRPPSIPDPNLDLIPDAACTGTKACWWWRLWRHGDCRRRSLWARPTLWSRSGRSTSTSSRR